MGAFSGLKDAKRGFQSNPLRAGKYVVRVDGCDFFDTEQAGEMWKNTLTILAVLEEGEHVHKVGETVHTFFRERAGKKTFQSNLKAFMAGVLNVEDELIDEAAAEQALSETSPLKGLVTIVTARQRTSKDKKDDKTGDPVQYTVYSWSPCLVVDQESGLNEILDAIGEEAYAAFFPQG